MKILLNSDVLSIMLKVQNRLWSKDVYFVGGYVRDLLFGKESRDLDLATSVDPETVRKAFPEALCFEKFGTASYVDNGYHVTIASFRKESRYLDFRHPVDVTFISDLNEDSKRRDFTLNALYLASSGEIRDPTGMGINDCEKKILRLILDPDTRIKEDPLRIIRGYRLKEKLGLSIEEKTKEAMDSNRDLLSRLNPSKIREELKKCPVDVRNKLINELQLDFVYNIK